MTLAQFAWQLIATLLITGGATLFLLCGLFWLLEWWSEK